MAPRIRRDDIATVREKARIEDVVGEQVTLRSAGVGSMKGLCPFHDERTPSFHVRPPVGLWHCFGCGEGGDVISFVQKIDHLTFAESVERLAEKFGVTLRYEDEAGAGVARPREEPGRRQRLVEAHRVAAAFFAEQLVTAEASIGRSFLAERGFDRAAAATYGVGYAPKGWDSLMRHLSARGFTQAEMSIAGLVSQGNRGFYDRFRGRLMWPIRDITGDIIGFGARRLFEDDPGPKYLNTPETPIYHKAQVLYGLDLAKKAISTQRQIVVVEGYTDVMACHLAGIPTAVATCGTSFGPDHVRIARRLLGDGVTGANGIMLASGHAVGGEVIFTFDGDAAGQKAALRAYGEDQSFAAQTFVAVSAGGMDPCDVRIQRGDVAVRELVSTRVPLFEFAIRSALASVDLATAEGRVSGLAVAAPVVAGIRDHALRGEYARQLAGWLGMDPADVRRRVTGAARSTGQQRPAGPGESQSSAPLAPRTQLPSDPVSRIEQQVLEAGLQQPRFAAESGFDLLDGVSFQVPALRAVHDAIRAAGGVTTHQRISQELGGGAEGDRGASATWLADVREGATSALAPLVRELTLAPIPADEDEIPGYVRGVVVALRQLGLTRQIADLRGALNSTGSGGTSDPASDPRAILARLTELEGERRRLSQED